MAGKETRKDVSLYFTSFPMEHMILRGNNPAQKPSNLKFIKLSGGKNHVT